MISQKKIDISVIVCCYNPDIEKLKKTINSINKQKNVEFEIIISDDGSKNCYFEEIQKWCNDNLVKNVKYNFLKENVGTIKNILSAIELCCSDCIKPISPGDFLFDSFSLEKYFYYLNEYDVVFGDNIYYYENELIRRRYPKNRFVYVEEKFKKTFTLYNNFVTGAAFAYKKNIFYTYLSNVKDKVIYLEDYSTILQACINDNRIKGIEEPLIWYECNTGISGKNSPLIRKDTCELFSFILDYYDENYRFIRVLKKLVKINKNKRLIKAIKYLFLHPQYYFYRFSSAFNKPKKYSVSIEEMYKMINFGDD